MKKKILSITILILILLSNLYVYAIDEQTEIPTTYDLRNDINIKVEKQITGDSSKGPVCYHYAKTKVIETYLQKTKGISYNLSETYYAYCGEDVDGVFVLEKDFPNKLFSQISNIEQKTNEISTKAVIKEFDYLHNIDKNTETLKKYIMKYGGVLVTQYSDNQWDNYKGGIYHKEKYSGNFHAITIIGWDDNYSKDNFYYEKPENDGAWLVLNTWGNNWGNSGTGWISYEDYYNLKGSIELIGSITLSDGEIIETKLTGEKQEEIKETETPVIEQETQKMLEEYNNMQNIFIIVFAVAVILLILLIIIKHRNLSKSKDNKGNKKSKLKIVLTIALILILLTFIFML